MIHYDHINFHLDDFPKDLPPKNAADHMGYYFAWAVSQNLHSDAVRQLPLFHLLESGKISGTTFVLGQLNSGIDETCFNDLGNRFTQYYYADDEEGYGHFIEDYFVALGLNSSYDFYCTEDCVQNQEKLNVVFQTALERWQQSLMILNGN